MKQNAFLNSSARKGFILSAVLGVLFLTLIAVVTSPAEAASGIQKTINFQGKVVNSDGTNVTDGAYDFVVQIYDGAGNAASSLFSESWTSSALFTSTMSSAPSTSSDTLTYSSNTNEATLKVGQILWNTTKQESVIITTVNTGTNVLGISRPIQNWDNADTITNRIYVKDGVFRIAINSLNQDISGVNFGTDNLFVGVNFNADGEMRPRMQLRSNAYAYNAEKVNGLTVTNTSDAAFTSTTTLKVNDGSTVTFGADFSSGSNALTLTTSGSTTLTLPTTGTLATLAGSELLTNKSIGNTGLVFANAATDITTDTNEGLTLEANGTGDITLVTDAGSDLILSGMITDANGLLYTTTTGVVTRVTETETGSQCLLSGAGASGAPSWGSCGGTTLWSGIGNPTGNLSLAMSTHTSAFNWATGTSTNNLFSLTTDASANGTGALLNLQTGASSTVLPMRVRAGSVEALMVDANGNVGIGLTDPANVLGVNRDQNDSTAIVIRNQASLGNTNASSSLQLIGTGISGGLYAYPSDSSTGRWQDRIVLKADSNAAGFSLEAATGGQDIRFYSGGTTESMRIDSSGNLGIGITNPGSKLEVVSATSGDQARFSSTGANNAAITIDNQAGSRQSRIDFSDAGTMKFQLGKNSDNSFFLYDGANTRDALNITTSGHLLLQPITGNVGIGTTTPTTGKLVISDAAVGLTADAQQISATTGTSTTGVDGLQIDYATAGTTVSTDNAGLRVNVTSNNSGATTTLDGISIGNLSSAEANATETGLKIGTGWDVGIAVASGGIQVTGGGLTLSGGGMTYTNGARPTKTITLSPEYSGAVLTAYYGAGTDTDITGSMTSDTDTTQGTSIRNYYQWERATATQHFYTVAVRVTLPKDFSAWATSNALVVNYLTESGTNTNSDLDVRVYNENSATIVASSTDNASTSWTTVAIDDSVLDDGASSEWDAADEVAVIYLRMGSQSGNHVRIGDITLNYLAAF